MLKTKWRKNYLHPYCLSFLMMVHLSNRRVTIFCIGNSYVNKYIIIALTKKWANASYRSVFHFYPKEYPLIEG